MSHKGTERDSAEPDPESPEPSAGDESHQTHAPNNFIILSADPPQSGDGSLGLKDLHPLTRPLTIADLNSCVALENAAFEEHERCSREKVISGNTPFQQFAGSCSLGGQSCLGRVLNALARDIGSSPSISMIVLKMVELPRLMMY